MRHHASFLFGSFALVAGLAACGDDSGGGGAGGDTSSSSAAATVTSGGPGPSSSSSSSKASSSSGGDGGDTGAGGDPAGTGGDPTGTGGTGAGGDPAGTGGTGPGTGGGAGTGGDPGTGGGNGCDGVELTVKNYLSWCDVSVDGIAPFGGPQQVVCVEEGEIPLAATPHVGFALGDDMWHHTDGDEGDGEPGDVEGDVSSAVVTVSGDGACVWVCCEFEAGGGCNVPDQCD